MVAVAKSYHQLSIAEKQAHAVAGQRERPTVCLTCDMQMMPDDLPNHKKRCSGPGPAIKFVTWPEALALGVPHSTFGRWVNEGLIRYEGDPPDRKYVKRDLIKELEKRGRLVVETPDNGSDEP